ncbi:aminotransferase [Actinoplanes sp. ATCC 53533]|uniref:aminotransferase class IV family protein n=1 Tax=Actinoplanes sp. ATCC 53533 TaxID=1288362 RepID=UPI000F78820D|nr:aminotransferase class IV family protein [Actinoplanes sp. ATCC 53533]RSM47546.1 aminotransferase [Actinoplanes sp. ATCC 53533]
MAELNGRPVGVEQLQTLALTNFGHFTSFRVDDGGVRGLALHLARLERDCQAVFGVPLDPDRVRRLIRRLVPASGAVTIRVTIFDPATDLARPAGANSPQILVTRRPAATLPLAPMTVQSVSYVRDAPEIKSVGLFGTMRQRRIAQLNGYDDALFVDEAGNVSEGGTWNVGFFDGEHVVWPEARCLAGITMRLLQNSPRKMKTTPVSLGELGSMPAAFATNSAVGVRAITRIDDLTFPAGSELLEALRMAYRGVAPEAV